MSPQYSNTKLRKRYYDIQPAYTEYKPTAMEHSKAFAIVIAIIATLVIITLTFGCESQSGRLSQIPKEKVVILDSDSKIASDNGRQYVITNYKVKRIDYGVIDWISIQGKSKYECGDTIYHRFMP
jgi:hypothetical protein